MTAEIEVSIPERIYYSLSVHKGELRSYDQISFDIWGEAADDKRRQTMKKHFSNLRPGLDDEFIYTVAGEGAVLSPLSPSELKERVEQGEMTLSSLGLSSVSPEEERRIRRNHPANHPKILRLMKRLDLEQKGESAPYLKPRLSPPEQGILKCLAQKKELGSREELIEAAGIDKSQSEDANDRLRQHISFLRKKLPEETKIVYNNRSGWILGRELTAGERVPKTAADLLAFMEARPGQCVKYEEIFKNIFDYDLNSLRKYNLDLLAAHRKIARRHLKEDWQLAAIKGYDMEILCQGELGDKVELPGLYDFSGVPPEVKKVLAPMMERGVMGKQGIKPAFTQTESSILLELAAMPEKFVLLPDLEDHLLGVESYKKGIDVIRHHICNLGKKLKELSANIKIENRRSRGYKLVLGDS